MTQENLDKANQLIIDIKKAVEDLETTRKEDNEITVRVARYSNVVMDYPKVRACLIEEITKHIEELEKEFAAL